jgi:hypothetical protein
MSDFMEKGKVVEGAVIEGGPIVERTLQKERKREKWRGGRQGGRRDRKNRREEQKVSVNRE